MALCASASAQADNLGTLQNMQKTGTGTEAFEMVEQGGAMADQLKKNLENVKLPDGFKIDLFALVPMPAISR